MNIKIKKDKDNVWGYLESYRLYTYPGCDYVEAVTGVGMNGGFTTPFVYRGEKFIPLSVVDEEMGIQKYLKAKKPFYSLLSDGFVVKLRSYIDRHNRKYFPDKSYFEIYYLNELNSVSDTVSFSRVTEIPESINILMQELLRELGETFGDRELFLRNRLR